MAKANPQLVWAINHSCCQGRGNEAEPTEATKSIRLHTRSPPRGVRFRGAAPSDKKRFDGSHPEARRRYTTNKVAESDITGKASPRQLISEGSAACTVLNCQGKKAQGSSRGCAGCCPWGIFAYKSLFEVGGRSPPSRHNTTRVIVSTLAVSLEARPTSI